MGYVIVLVFIVIAFPFLLAFSRKNQPKGSRKGKSKNISKSEVHIERFDDGHEIQYKVVKDINRELSISYVDSEGSQTTRQINALQLHKNGNAWFLYAFCQLRQANRHFRIVNFKKIVDHQTGEIVEKRFVEYLRSI